RGHTGAVNVAAFSPDGSRVVTASADGTARIWNPQTDTEIAVFEGSKDHLFSARFNPDGTGVITASADKTVQIWDVRTHAQIAVFNRDPAVKWFSASFSPDGKRVVAASADRIARIWDVESAALIALLEGNKAKSLAQLSARMEDR